MNEIRQKLQQQQELMNNAICELGLQRDSKIEDMIRRIHQEMRDLKDIIKQVREKRQANSKIGFLLEYQHFTQDLDRMGHVAKSGIDVDCPVNVAAPVAKISTEIQNLRLKNVFGSSHYLQSSLHSLPLNSQLRFHSSSRS
jgi:hypothetical protein